MRRILLFSLCLLVAGACLALGVWQLRRLSSRRAVNRGALAGRVLPPLEVPGAEASPLQSDRRARLEGELDEAHEFVLRGRVVQGAPAVQIVTPLRIAGSDTAILLNRGYVPAPDAFDPGDVAWSERGRRRFDGILLRVPDRGDGNPTTRAGRETWKSLDLSGMRARLPYPVASVYLVVAPDSPAAIAHTARGRVYPFRAEPPPRDDGPHLMYAVQWFGIAAAVVAFGIIFVLRARSVKPVDP